MRAAIKKAWSRFSEWRLRRAIRTARWRVDRGCVDPCDRLLVLAADADEETWDAVSRVIASSGITLQDAANRLRRFREEFR